VQDVCKLSCNILIVKGFVNKFDGTLMQTHPHPDPLPTGHKPLKVREYYFSPFKGEIERGMGY